MGVFKITLLHGCFSRSLNCTNGTKLCKASQICLYKSAQVGFHSLNFVRVTSMTNGGQPSASDYLSRGLVGKLLCNFVRIITTA